MSTSHLVQTGIVEKEHYNILKDIFLLCWILMSLSQYFRSYENVTSFFSVYNYYS